MSANSLLLEDNQYLQSYLNESSWVDNTFYRTFFPLKFNPTLTAKTLIADQEAPVVADVVSFNSSAPEKTRQVVDARYAEIPPLRVKRILDEVKLNEYLTLTGQQNPPEDQIMDMIFNDTKFCFNAIEASRERMAMQALSNFELTFNTTNNEAGAILQTTIDFQLPGARKRACVGTTTRVWNNGTVGNYLPITDFEDIMQTAEDAGTPQPAWALMNTASWRQFRKATEVLNFVLPHVQNKPSAIIPSVAASSLPGINSALKEAGLPQIIIINTRVNLENQVHLKTINNPWQSGMVTFLPQDPRVGSMLYAPIAEESFKAKHAMYASRDGTLISKWSETDPVKEITAGLSNCFPQISNLNGIWRLNTLDNAADGLD